MMPDDRFRSGGEQQQIKSRAVTIYRLIDAAPGKAGYQMPIASKLVALITRASRRRPDNRADVLGRSAPASCAAQPGNRPLPKNSA
jgi:hypothetical protein